MRWYGAEDAVRHAKMQAEMWGRCWVAHSIALMTGGSQSCLLSTQDSTRLTGNHHLLRNVVAAWATAARALLNMLHMLLILNQLELDLAEVPILSLNYTSKIISVQAPLANNQSLHMIFAIWNGMSAMHCPGA